LYYFGTGIDNIGCHHVERSVATTGKSYRNSAGSVTVTVVECVDVRIPPKTILLTYIGGTVSVVVPAVKRF